MSISGKPKEICIQALKVANGDPNIAFEFLMQYGAGGDMMEGDMEGGNYEMAGEDDYGDEEGGEGSQL
jgi:hypothetical protein